MSGADLDVVVSVRRRDFALSAAFTTTGHVIGVLGPSGAGKTTLLECLTGLCAPDRGKVRLGQTDLTNTDSNLCLPPEDRRVGYVPQDPTLFPHLTVAGNLTLVHGAAARRGRHPMAVSEAADLCGVTHLLSQRAATLSGGEARRAALCRALVSAPRLLVLDEPFTGLNAALRTTLLCTLLRLGRLGLPMVVVSHDPYELQVLCDELICLDAGGVVAQGAPRDVLLHPASAPVMEGHSLLNVLPATVDPQAPGLHVDGVTWQAPGLSHLPPGPALVSFRAEDALLATARPEGLSARNHLMGTLDSLCDFQEGQIAHVHTAASQHPLAVALNPGTAETLSLSPGTPVHLLVKAQACRVFALETAPHG